MKKYFDVRDMIKESPRSTMLFILGQGGVGKTYSCKREVIINFLKNDKKFIYCRRWTTDIGSNRLYTVFADTETDKEVLEAIEDWKEKNPTKADDKFEAYHFLPKGQFFYLVGERDDATLKWICQCGRITCISDAEKFKGGVYNIDTNRLLFDEFITEFGYITKGNQEEPALFSKILGTIARDGNKVICYLCGNPDANYEANPYLYNLKLDFSRLQNNTIYKFDTLDTDGKTVAENVALIKLANFSGASFIDKSAANIFGTAEEAMRATGKLKENDYAHIDNIEDIFESCFELIVETPIITNIEYHKKMYVYYGVLYGEPCMVALNHRSKKLQKSCPLYCRYDKTALRNRSGCRQTYRVNIPPLEEFNELRRIMNAVEANQFKVSNDNATATLYEQIILNG